MGNQNSEDQNYNLPYMKLDELESHIRKRQGIGAQEDDVQDFGEVLRKTKYLNLNDYRQNFVRIQFTNNAETKKGQGTGFIFKSTKKKMYVLTCLHNIYEVVKQNGFSYRGQKYSKFRVHRQSKKNNYGNKIVYTENNLRPIIYTENNDFPNAIIKKLYLMDFALIVIDKKSQEVEDILTDVPLEADIEKIIKKDDIFIFGYTHNPPKHTNIHLKGSYGDAKIRVKSQTIQNKWEITIEQLVYQNHTYSGYSGSPILHYDEENDRIQIIGIHTHTQRGRQNIGLKLDYDLLQWIQNVLEKQRYDQMTPQQKKNYQFTKQLENNDEIVQIDLILPKQMEVSQLKRINYKTTQDEAFSEVLKKIKNKKIIQKIKMTKKNLTERIVRQIKKFYNLKYLDLSYNLMGNKQVKQFLSIQSIEIFLFRQNLNLDNHVLNMFKSLPVLTNLKFLYLGNLYDNDIYSNLIINQVKESNIQKEIIEMDLISILDRFPNLEKLEIGFSKILNPQTLEPKLHLQKCVRQIQNKIDTLWVDLDNKQKKYLTLDNRINEMRRAQQAQQLEHFEQVIKKWQYKQEERIEKQQKRNYLKIQLNEDLNYKRELNFKKLRQNYQNLKRELSGKQKQDIIKIQSQIEFNNKQIEMWKSKLKLKPNYQRQSCICFQGRPCIE